MSSLLHPILAAWLATYMLHSTAIFAIVWLLHRRVGTRVNDFLWKATLLLPLLTTTARVLGPTGGPIRGTALEWTLPRLDAGVLPARGQARPEFVELPGFIGPSPDQSDEFALSLSATRPAGKDPRFAWAGALVFLVVLSAGFLLVARSWFQIHSRLRARRRVESGTVIEELTRLR
ncbi:MAG: hypothetical protein AAGG01_17900, partial [Planctomycetota bacterium]